jgi:hypothetical protein
LNTRGDRTWRHVQGAGRCGKAAAVDDLHERRHISHAIHTAICAYTTIKTLSSRSQDVKRRNA